MPACVTGTRFPITPQSGRTGEAYCSCGPLRDMLPGSTPGSPSGSSLDPPLDPPWIHPWIRTERYCSDQRGGSKRELDCLYKLSTEAGAWEWSRAMTELLPENQTLTCKNIQVYWKEGGVCVCPAFRRTQVSTSWTTDLADDSTCIQFYSSVVETVPGNRKICLSPGLSYLLFQRDSFQEKQALNKTALSLNTIDTINVILAPFRIGKLLKGSQ